MVPDSSLPVAEISRTAAAISVVTLLGPWTVDLLHDKEAKGYDSGTYAVPPMRSKSL
jgi:hypothetical protein